MPPHAETTPIRRGRHPGQCAFRQRDDRIGQRRFHDQWTVRNWFCAGARSGDADNRDVEQTILPLAQERKIGVLACFPFGGNVGPDRTTVVSRLFGRAGSTHLPDWVRMAQYVDALPGAPVAAPQGPVVAVPAAILDRYVGEYRMASGGIWTFRRVDAALLLKPRKMDEVLLVARSETRFTDARGTGPIMEFQLDGAGTVTGLWLEVGGGRTLLTRVR